ncbi:MAG: hypothetical protein JXA21_02195 [Anaerolineae bacterium]|nr:hypothetical protein [Anaerolineae bacterium]
MALPTQHVQVVAGAPIAVGEHRLLPAVLVTTMEGGTPGTTVFRSVALRPVSIVEETPEGAHWLEIPNATEDTIHTFMAIGLALATVCALVVMLAQVIRRR